MIYGNKFYNYNKKSFDDVNFIIDTLSPEDKKYIMLDEGEKYLQPEEYKYIFKRTIMYNDNIPVCFVDLLIDGNNLNIIYATNSNYRGLGFASSTLKESFDYVDNHKNKLKKINIKQIVWGVYTSNKVSIHLATKFGFKLDKKSYSDDKKMVNYIKKL